MMHLKKVIIQNFRSLEYVEAEFDSLVNVIIGPNATGKTSILEAIRLAKAVLSPRTQNESGQTLNSLGVTSPHMPQRFFPAALTNKPTTPVVVKTAYKMMPEEFEKLQSLLPQIISRVAQEEAGLGFAAPTQVMAFLSSLHGQHALAQANENLGRELTALRSRMLLNLNLTIDFSLGRMSGEFPLQQIFFTALDQSPPPNRTLFSYFPADRALPMAEQPVQLGAADTINQLESYNSQPQLKYNRLKHTIFNSIILGDQGRDILKGQFKSIFNNILKGRELGEIGVNDIGVLSIPIIDKDSGVEFQMDGLSSGEKGLLLTLLLIAMSVEKNGIILLDEPELHLNPAVCRDLLQFFVDEYCVKQNIQGIICSHSAEILGGAFERANCSVHHLREGNRGLAQVTQQDEGEIRDALRRLGSSESEALLYRGTISVEGIHDVEILRLGFDEFLRRYKIKDRGGRKNIEKDIEDLQRAEIRGDEIGSHMFIFDHDGKPTNLKNSVSVRFLQLSRYCLENYLLDIDTLTDISRDPDFSREPKDSISEMKIALKNLAILQLGELTSRDVFVAMGLEEIAFDMGFVKNADEIATAEALGGQLTKIQLKISEIMQTDFRQEFKRLYDLRLSEKKDLWDDKWRELCNGKRLLIDMRREGHFSCDLLKLKKAVMSRIKARKTEGYAKLESEIRDLIEIR